MAIPGSNNFAGEYVQTPRKTLFQCPVIAGYTTGRLVSQQTLQFSGTVPSGTIPSSGSIRGAWPNTQVLGFFENDGPTAITVQLQQCNDRTPTGTRTNLGSAIALVAYGKQTQVIQPTEQYLEVLGVSGTGNICMTLDGQIRWTECCFSKDELAGTGGQFYPLQVWGPANLPPILGPINPTDGPAQFNW